LFGNYSTTISVDVLCKLIDNFNVVQVALCFSRVYQGTWNRCVSIISALKVVFLLDAHRMNKCNMPTYRLVGCQKFKSFSFTGFRQ